MKYFPLRLQFKPFQRQSDHVGACLDGVNRSVQFCRDHFGAGVRFRHSSKAVILLWRPSFAAAFSHGTTRDYTPISHSAASTRNHGQPTVAATEAVMKVMDLKRPKPAPASLLRTARGRTKPESRSDDEDR